MAKPSFAAVRNLIRAGVTESVAMKMTEHKTHSVFRRYAIVDEAMIREAVDKLATSDQRKSLPSERLRSGGP